MASSRFSHDILMSQLYDEKTFYPAFLQDLSNCKKEVIIESPFITTERTRGLRNIFEKLLSKGVKVYIFTRGPGEHSGEYRFQSEAEIQFFEAIGVQVFLCLGNHHRKLAILDRTTLWEGSLNVLSHKRSREIMRRTEGKESAKQMFDFLKFEEFL